MMRFPQILSVTAADCNRARKPLGIAVLIVGSVSILVTFVLWGTMLRSGMQELRMLLGPEAAMRVEEQVMMMKPGPEMQGVMMNVMAELQAKFDQMPEEEKAMVMSGMFSRLFVTVGPVLIGFILLTLILKLWSGTFFLLLGVRKNPRFGKLAGEAIAWMLPVLGVGVMISVAVVGWMIATGIVAAIAGAVVHEALGALVLVLVGFGGILAFGPRFSLAPAFLLQDNAGVIGSLKRSFRVTKGHWLKVVGNFIGAAAIVWIIVFVIQFFLNLFIGALPASPASFVIGQLMIFVMLIGTAYQAVFLVRLKEAIAGK